MPSLNTNKRSPGASCTREFWYFQLGKTPRTAPSLSSSCTEPEARLRIGGGWPAQVYRTVFFLHQHAVEQRYKLLRAKRSKNFGSATPPKGSLTRCLRR